MLPQLEISVTWGFMIAAAGWGGDKVTVLPPACGDVTDGVV